MTTYLAQKLIQFPSLYPPGNEKACVEFVAQHLRSMGFTVETYEFASRRPSLVARLGGLSSRKSLAFTGHLDVVPVGVAQWHFRPFDAVLDDGALHGRGSCDMKSGIAAFITAAGRLQAEGTVLRRGLIFVITAGEETGCEGVFDLAKRKILGEAELLIVAEPTSNQPVIAHQGSLRVVVTARGRTAHSSMPHEGENAISKVVRWITCLEAHRFEKVHPLLGRTTTVTTTIMGGQNINSVPDSASFTVDFRTLSDNDHAALLNLLRDLFGVQAHIGVVTDFKGFSTIRTMAPLPRSLPFWQKDWANRRRPLVHRTSLISSACFGICQCTDHRDRSGRSAQCHKTDERCSVSDIDDATAIYEELMRRLCL